MPEIAQPGDVTGEAFASVRSRSARVETVSEPTDIGARFDAAIDAFHGPDDQTKKGPGFWSSLGEKAKGAAHGTESLFHVATQNRLGKFLKKGAESYINKFDPRDKNKTAWISGIAAGAGSVLAVAEFGATLGLTPALRGITAAAVIHGSNFLYGKLHNAYLNRALSNKDLTRFGRDELRGKIKELEKNVAATKLKGPDFANEYRRGLDAILDRYAPFKETEDGVYEQDRAWVEETRDRLVRLGTDYAVVNSTAKSLAAGLSAGSFVAAMGEVGVRALAKGSLGTLGEHFSQPKATLPQSEAPLSDGSSGTTASGPEAASSVAPASPSLPSNIQEKIAAVSKTAEYKTGIAANVGKYLSTPDQIASKALSAKNLVSANVDTDTLRLSHDAILHAMEGKANEVYDAALKEVVSSNPNASLDSVTKLAAEKYAGYLSSAEAQNYLQGVAQKAIDTHFDVVNKTLTGINQALEASPGSYHEVLINKGDTAGKILNLTWTNADAPSMGSTIAANYHLLTEEWAHVAAVNPDLVANNPFPVSLSEINSLVLKAQDGDEDAIRKLRLALHWIPAGAKLKVLTKAGAQALLKKAA